MESNQSDFLEFPVVPLCKDPRLQARLETYLEESLFGFKLVSKDLLALPLGSRVLEVGSGIGLLARHISLQGYSVTALEPSAGGFEFMRQLQKHISGIVQYKSLADFVETDIPIESFSATKKYDYIFSINVLEHVLDVNGALDSMLDLLNPGGQLRIICPNYSFPYDGHFNIPFIINSKYTYRIFSKRILSFPNDNPLALWKSINGVKAKNLLKLIKKDSRVSGFMFSRFAMQAYLHRASFDEKFIQRKGRILIFAAKWLIFSINLFPLKYTPVIDCSVYRNAKEEVNV